MGKNVGILTVFGLVVAVVGIFAPIAWDLYKGRAELSLEHLSTAALVNTDQPLDKLAVLYDSKPIPNLSRVAFALANTGRTPIRSQDFVSHPRIEFKSPAEILEVRTDRVTPSELQFTTASDPSKRAVEIRPPLMNPSDRIEISVLVTGLQPKFQASARIVGIETLRVVDWKPGPSGRLGLRDVPGSVYVVTAGSLFCLFVAAMGFRVLGVESELRQLWRANLIVFPATGSQAHYREHVRRAFRPEKTEDELKPIYRLLDTFPKEGNLAEDQIAALQGAIRTSLDNRMSARAGTSLFAALGLIGLSYSLWALVSALQK